MKITKEHFSKAAAIITIVVALLVLIGWIFNIPVLKSILPQWPAMKFNAAICLLLSGITLYLLNKPSVSLTEKKVAQLFASFILIIGLLTLSQYLFGYNAGIDELFWKDDRAAVLTTYLGRMILIAAFNFTLLGFIFLILLNKKFHLIVQIMLLLMVPAFIQVFLNYSFGTSLLNFIPQAVNAAFHTVILFPLLFMGVLFSTPLSYLTFSFQKKIIGFFALVIIMMILIFSVINENQQQLIDSPKLVDHSLTVIIQSEKLLDDVIDLESGSRGFVITGDEKFLEPYTMAIKSITEQLKDLRVLTIDNPRHQLKIDSLEIWIKERIYFLAPQIEVRKAGGFDEAKTLIKTRPGKFYTDRIRRMIRDLQQDENDLSEKYKAVNQQNIENSKRAVIVFQIIIGIVLVIIILIIRKNTLARNKAEEKIKDSEEQYKQLVEDVSDIIYKIDLKGLFVYANQIAIRAMNMGEREIIGLHFTEFIRSDYRKNAGRFYKEQFENRTSTTYYEFIAVTGTGEEVWIGQNVKLIYEEGRVCGMQAVGRDITNIKKSQIELTIALSRMSSLITNLNTGILLESSDHKIVLVNDKFCEIFGIPAKPEQLVGRDCSNSEQVKHLFVNPDRFESDISSLINKREKVIGQELIMNNGNIYERDFIPIIVGDEYLGHLWQYKDVTKVRGYEIKIREQKIFYETIINAVPADLVVFDENRKYQFVNPLSVKDPVMRQWLIGKDDYDYCKYTGKDIKIAEGREKIFYDAVNKKEPIQLYEEITNKVGEIECHLRIMNPIYDNKGKLKYVLGYGVNITSVKLAERELQKAKELAETMYKAQQAVNKELANYKYAFDQSSIVAITDQKGIIRYANDNFCKISKFSPEELIGQDHRIISSGYHTKEYIRNLWTTIANGKVWKGEFKNKAKDGIIYWVDATIIPFLDEKGKIYQYVAVRFDITERKKIETDLIQAKELAEYLAHTKDQFLASMSHEIRTPLNGIIGFTKILLKNGLTEKQRKYMDAVKISSDVLLVLINDILDLAKIEAGKMTIEETELKLSNLVGSIFATFELRLEEKELKVTQQYDKRIPKILLGDSVRITQVFLNLINNAIKFTNNGGNIGVSVNLKNQNEEKAIIEIIVSDTGIGIPADKLETIFDPFTQSSSHTARRYGGTGLGLSIVKRLMDLMGGTISVKSQMNMGSTFTVSLPLKKTTATEIFIERTVSQAETLKRLGKLKILIVEDIPINQFLAQTIMHNFGFETDTADNGKIAIELLEKNNYDLILMDLMMPEMDGYEATEHIRLKMQPPKSTIPIIALTADITQTDMKQCVEVGMNEYVSKPINETDLLDKIARLVKKNSNQVIGNQQETIKICNLDYLKSKKSNYPKFVTEMLQMILKETPVYLEEAKGCLSASDWEGLHGSIHKVRPLIYYIGLPKHIEDVAKLMDDYVANRQHLDLIPDLFLKVEKAFQQAFKELEEELKTMKS